MAQFDDLDEGLKALFEPSIGTDGDRRLTLPSSNDVAG
jgi:hypothetical protein